MTQPIVIGLTGSIGMGKSTVTAQFAALGAHTCNADAFVHSLMAKGGEAVPEIEMHFAGVVKNGAVDRKLLGAQVFGDPEKMALLESILHPLVIAMEEEFVAVAGRFGAKIVVMDIPLLFETGGEARCDVVVVASTTHLVQRQRVMARANMTAEKFEKIIAAQLPDLQKRNMADFVVHTGLGKAHSFRQVKNIWSLLQGAA